MQFPMVLAQQEQPNSTSFFQIENQKSICCIGAGYVGVPSMATIALNCPEVKIIIVDKNSERITAWSRRHYPLFEPGLAEALEKTLNKNLFFSTHISLAIQECDIIYVCVDTPTKTVGIGAGRAANLSPLESAGRIIASSTNRNKIVIEKSTVPVNTARALEQILSATSGGQKHVVLSNPEFLAEGSAMCDLQNPDRVLIGGPSTPEGIYAVAILVKMYSRWIPGERILTMNQWSSELSKLCANAFLAQRVSSINAVAMLCEQTGADIDEVSLAIGSDSRIGSKFLKPSIGFGGSCFKKDISNLMFLSESLGLHAISNYWKSVLDLNEFRQDEFVRLILGELNNNLCGKILTIFGVSFKKDTSDTRESPAIAVGTKLVEEGAILHVYDPQATVRDISGGFIQIADPYLAAKNSHAIIVLTEWDEFLRVDYKAIFDMMIKPSFVFDGRNILNHCDLERIGFTVRSIGKSFRRR